VLQLSGPVVLDTLFVFRGALNQENAAVLVLDFTQVPFIDSAGLGSLIAAHVRQTKCGGRLALAGLNAKCRALLEMTRVEGTLAVYPTLEEAFDTPD
jgi:anti-sigma B factor antagonist